MFHNLIWWVWRSWLSRQIVALEAEGSNPSTHPSLTGNFFLSGFIGPSPSGKAQDFDSCSRQFESGWPSFGILAQVVEHLTFNQVVRGSSPRCLSNDMVCKDHQKKSSSTTFFCGVKLPLFTSPFDIILSLNVTQNAVPEKLLGTLKVFVHSVFNLVFS